MEALCSFETCALFRIPEQRNRSLTSANCYCSWEWIPLGERGSLIKFARHRHHRCFDNLMKRELTVLGSFELLVKLSRNWKHFRVQFPSRFLRQHVSQPARRFIGPSWSRKAGVDAFADAEPRGCSLVVRHEVQLGSCPYID
jgi:hypothetical protein